jgi:threonine dehydrogenase-like Zn-dependent dehydrogenase
VVRRISSSWSAAPIAGLSANRWASTPATTTSARLWSAGFDLVVDATGVPAAIQSGLDAVAKGGRFLQVGVAPPESRIELSPFQLYNQEITLHGSMAVLDSYAPALKLIADGVVDVNPILTHVYPLAEYMEAFEALGRGEGLKIQISPGASL